MKRKLLVLAGACALMLSGCGGWADSVVIMGRHDYEAMVLGRWVNDGTAVEWAGEEGGNVVALTFEEDDRLTVETADGRTYEYGYTMTDDTMTIQQEDIAYGVPYETDGDTLTLGEDGSDGVYVYDAVQAVPEE